MERDDVPVKIYLGGPIDYAREDPDVRHVDLSRILDGYALKYDVFCPFCDQREEPLTPAERVWENHDQLTHCDVAVFVWDPSTQPSIGVPIEIWLKSQETKHHSHPVSADVILVSEGTTPSLFLEFFTGEGMKMARSLEDAAAIIMSRVRQVKGDGTPVLLN